MRPSQEAHSVTFVAGGWSRLMFCLLVLVPAVVCVLLPVVMVWMARQTSKQAKEEQASLIEFTQKVSSLIIDLNRERELTLLVSASTNDQQIQALRPVLQQSIRLSDESLALMTVWPSTPSDGYRMQSWHIFNAVLQSHRNERHRSQYYWDEIQFYTEVIDHLNQWLTRGVSLAAQNSDLWQWLTTASGLMSAVNFLGVEQGLCGIYKYMVCFSHRETFSFANYSYSADMALKFYHENHPLRKTSRPRSHRVRFPALHVCRNDIMADMETMESTGPNDPCEVETNQVPMRDDVMHFVQSEMRTIEENMQRTATRMTTVADNHISVCSLILTSVIVYLVAVTMVRLIIIAFYNRTKSTRQYSGEEIPDDFAEHEQDEDFDNGAGTSASESHQKLCNGIDQADYSPIKIATV